MGGIRFFIFMFITITLLIVLMIGSTAEHEYIHQLIFKDYNINSTVKFYFWDSFKDAIAHPFSLNILDSQPAGVTYPDQNSTGICNETCENLHTQLEITEHGSMNVVAALFILFILSILYIEFFKVDVKEKFREAIKEEKHDQEFTMLKDEYQRLTGNVWDPYTEYTEEDGNN